MNATRHQTGEMRHVDEQHGSGLVRDVPEFREVEEARIGRVARYDDLGPTLERESPYLLHVDSARLLVERVMDRVEPLAGRARGRPVRQVPSVAEVEAEHGIPWLGEG